MGVWSVIRQKQRWSGNSMGRLVIVFIINTLFSPICLIISLYNKNFLSDGKPPVPIDDFFGKKNSWEK